MCNVDPGSSVADLFARPHTATLHTIADARALSHRSCFVVNCTSFKLNHIYVTFSSFCSPVYTESSDFVRTHSHTFGMHFIGGSGKLPANAEWLDTNNKESVVYFVRMENKSPCKRNCSFKYLDLDESRPKRVITRRCVGPSGTLNNQIETKR